MYLEAVQAFGPFSGQEPAEPLGGHSIGERSITATVATAMAVGTDPLAPLPAQG